MSIRKKVIFVGQISTRKVIFVDLVIIFAARFGKKNNLKNKTNLKQRKMTISPGNGKKVSGGHHTNKQTKTNKGKQTNKEKC